jgi:hypothetical protein
MAGIDSNLITYFLNPAEHFFKRIFVFISIIVMLLVVDGYLGFSEFYFSKSKAETLNEISSSLRDTTITADNKKILQEDYNRIVRKESYKVELFRFLRSIWDNKITRTTEIKPMISKHPIQTAIKNFIEVTSESIFFKIFMYVLSSGFLFFYVGVRIFFYTDKSKDNFANIDALSLIFFGLFCSGIFLLIPPYEFGTTRRYVLNFIYSFIGSILLISWEVVKKLRDKKRNSST